MAPKAAKSKEIEDAQEEQEVLQALILADSFNERFKPLTSERPRVRLSSMHVRDCLT